MNNNELNLWLATFKMAKKGNKEALTDIRLENEKRKKMGWPSLEEDILSTLPSEEDIKSTIKKAEIKYDISNLTSNQLDDMLALTESGAKIGYIILDNIDSKEEWIDKIFEIIGKPIHNTTGFSDDEVRAVIADIWKAPYEVDGKEKLLSEWAEEYGIIDEDKEERMTLVWSEDWNPVWITRPKKEIQNLPLYKELQKEEPDEDLIEELQNLPINQLDEEIIIEVMGLNKFEDIDNPIWGRVYAIENRLRELPDRGLPSAKLTILDEDWGKMDPEEAESHLWNLANQEPAVWDSPSA